MFLLSREVLKDYLEKQLFKPVAEAHGWFEEDKNGVKKYWYPHVGFNRLTIRDNAEVFAKDVFADTPPVIGAVTSSPLPATTS